MWAQRISQETLKEEIAAREEERQNNEQVAVQAQSQVERLTSALQQVRVIGLCLIPD